VLLIKKGDRMPRPRVTNQLTTGQVARQLGMSVGRVVSWVERGALLPPSFIDNNGVRYFDQEWLKRAKEIVGSKQGNG
jgi:DNA-binding transcriptional MerR regulator